MNQELEKQQAIQKEMEQRKKEYERQLIVKAHQIRAVCMAGGSEFFKIGKEECEILRKVFPNEADKLLADAMKEKFDKAEKKDKKNPGSVDRTNLLQELEGLCGKALKTMLENMKSSDKSKENQGSGLSDAEKGISNAKQMSEVENVKAKEEAQKAKEDPQKAKENPNSAKETVVKNKKKGVLEGIKENLQDGHHEGFTGEKVIRREQEQDAPAPQAPVSKKEQKKLDKQQKKDEKAQRKEEKIQAKQEKAEKKAAKKQKVAPISKEDLDSEKGQDEAKSADAEAQEKANQAKLDAYNKKVAERAQANQAKQMTSSNVREMTGPVRKKN